MKNVCKFNNIMCQYGPQFCFIDAHYLKRPKHAHIFAARFVDLGLP